MYRISIFFLAFTIGSAVFSQEELGPLVTDRPDATEAPTVVPKKYFQIETGAYRETFDDGELKQVNNVYNTSLLRFGILNNLELRLGWNYGDTRIKPSNASEEIVATGFSPLLLGTKIAISEEKNGWPEIGLIGHLQLPFLASADYRPETTGVDFRFAFAHTLSERSSLSYNIGAEWGNDSPEATYIYTLAYGFSITNAFGIYAEVYGYLPEDNAPLHLWDAGLTYLLADNWQLDATIGRSWSDGQDLLLSAGLSIRIPN